MRPAGERGKAPPPIGPRDRRDEINGAGKQIPTPQSCAHKPPDFPVDSCGKNRYNGPWAQIISAVWDRALGASCIGAWGGANSPRPAFIYLGTFILHHTPKSCKRFFILHADLLLFSTSFSSFRCFAQFLIHRKNKLKFSVFLNFKAPISSFWGSD